ncbi:hypothetical protein M0804_013333 [Polistes exclamans]|nr:hypothetical protein M0804_013333 [Polistes exclamans]
MYFEIASGKLRTKVSKNCQKNVKQPDTPKEVYSVKVKISKECVKEVQIGDNKIKALIDTGNGLSLIKAEQYCKISVPELGKNVLRRIAKKNESNKQTTNVDALNCSPLSAVMPVCMDESRLEAETKEMNRKNEGPDKDGSLHGVIDNVRESLLSDCVVESDFLNKGRNDDAVMVVLKALQTWADHRTRVRENFKTKKMVNLMKRDQFEGIRYVAEKALRDYVCKVTPSGLVGFVWLHRSLSNVPDPEMQNSFRIRNYREFSERNVRK